MRMHHRRHGCGFSREWTRKSILAAQDDEASDRRRFTRRQHRAFGGKGSAVARADAALHEMRSRSAWPDCGGRARRCSASVAERQCLRKWSPPRARRSARANANAEILLSRCGSFLLELPESASALATFRFRRGGFAVRAFRSGRAGPSSLANRRPCRARQPPYRSCSRKPPWHGGVTAPCCMHRCRPHR